MKSRIPVFVALGILTMSIVACDDFLNNDPKTFVSEDGFYQTEGQIMRAVNGLYGQLQPIYNATGAEGGGNLFALAEMRSDNTSYQFDTDNRGYQQLEEIDEFLMFPDNNWLNSTWDGLYDVILQANKILANINDISFSEESDKNQAIGEVKSIRAFTYFHLVRLFGNIPLINESADSPEDAFTDTRASVGEVYDLIISDLNDAIEVLPESYESGQAGRITKGAAYTILGDVYMTRENYADAIATLENVTELNYSLLNNYADIYLPTNKNNAESIFEIQFNGSETGEENVSIFAFAPIAAPNTSTLFPFPNSGGGLGFNIPTEDMVNAYEDGDRRFDASIAFYTDSETSQYEVAIGDSIPFIKKTYHPSTYPGPGRATENWPVYRYSHVLLLLAEAYNEEGQTSQAYSYINMVRERAGLDPLSGLSQEQFRNAVYHEQRVELAFENHRWYNLLRTDRAIEIMTEHGQQQIQDTPRLTDAAYNIQDYKLLYPIPRREVRLNNFEQNPGW